MYTAIKMSFKTYIKYAKLTDLIDKLGIARELSRENLPSEFAAGINPKLVFTLPNAARRAIFVRVEDEEANRYSLIFPDKHSLYSKIYSLLKSKNLKVHAEMADFEFLRLPPEDLELLKRY